ncbi:MAG: hypothetical protein LUD14_13045 [Clostridiales bacterium]|nr:hypothetical protein [Clostridiales bacterium]
MGKIIQTAGRNALGDFAPDFAHTDLYDQTEVIPFDKLETFFNDYLNEPEVKLK